MKQFIKRICIIFLGILLLNPAEGFGPDVKKERRSSEKKSVTPAENNNALKEYLEKQSKLCVSMNRQEKLSLRSVILKSAKAREIIRENITLQKSFITNKIITPWDLGSIKHKLFSAAKSVFAVGLVLYQCSNIFSGIIMNSSKNAPYFGQESIQNIFINSVDELNHVVINTNSSLSDQPNYYLKKLIELLGIVNKQGCKLFETGIDLSKKIDSSSRKEFIIAKAVELIAKSSDFESLSINNNGIQENPFKLISKYASVHERETLNKALAELEIVMACEQEIDYEGMVPSFVGACARKTTSIVSVPYKFCHYLTGPNSDKAKLQKIKNIKKMSLEIFRNQLRLAMSK